ncbi:zf-HC2 domain-containing protein [Peptococcus simiae]|uniref:Zf-HC2 domain-containing protein n=1 Tax=Peptococcus simiae TaxID=1643805 RepID=A0ABW9H025_9FIRM
MKISCKVIEDLLPLYIDEVCSEESKKLIEIHLTGCSRCSEILEQMQSDYEPQNNIELNLKDAEPIKNLSNAWNKKLVGSMLKGVASTLFIVSLIFLLVYIFVGIQIG